MAAFEPGVAVSLLPRTCPENLYLGDCRRTQVRKRWPLWGEGEMQGKWVGFEISDEQENMAGSRQRDRPGDPSKVGFQLL